MVVGLAPPAAGAAAAAQGPAATQGLGPAVAACMCVAEGASKATARRVAQEAAPARRLGPAKSVWLAVFAGEHSTAQYVVGRSSEECCG